MIDKKLPRLMFKVDDVFSHNEDRLEALSFDAELDIGYRAGDIVELRKPDGSSFQAVSGVVHYSLDPLVVLSNPDHKRPLGLWFKGLLKTDIPIGTEVWMVVEHPVALKGRRFEYVGKGDRQEQASPVVEKEVLVNVENEGKGYPK